MPWQPRDSLFKSSRFLRSAISRLGWRRILILPGMLSQLPHRHAALWAAMGCWAFKVPPDEQLNKSAAFYVRIRR